MNYAAILASLLLPFAAETHAADAPEEKPHLIFILADDLGIDGVGGYGSDKRKTPNIDKLAASGMLCETCYAPPVCGVSRCALMTGRYAFRTGGIANDSWRDGGPGASSGEEHPVAKLLKQAGYATCQSGKWHQLTETPYEWGFDEYCTAPFSGWFWKNVVSSTPRIGSCASRAGK